MHLISGHIFDSNNQWSPKVPEGYDEKRDVEYGPNTALNYPNYGAAVPDRARFSYLEKHRKFSKEEKENLVNADNIYGKIWDMGAFPMDIALLEDIYGTSKEKESMSAFLHENPGLFLFKYNPKRDFVHSLGNASGANRTTPKK